MQVEALSFRIGAVPIVDDVSFEIRRGEFLAVIGPNGAGKTTLFDLLSGLRAPTTGRIHIGTRDVTKEPPYARARLGLGRTFQTSSIFAGLATFENVRLAARASLGGSGRPWRAAATERATIARAREALALVGLAERGDARAAALSHGEKRKLDLALLLTGKPDVVLLDEPTAGLAIEDVPEMTRLIRRIHRDEHRTVVMVEHRMDLVLELADRIAVMHHGTLLALDTPQRVVADAAVQSAYLGDGP